MKHVSVLAAVQHDEDFDITYKELKPFKRYKLHEKYYYFDITYKELKHVSVLAAVQHDEDFDITYKELKPFFAMGFYSGMRNFDITYKELKPAHWMPANATA